MPNVDLVIVGGGMVGASLALALKATDLNILLLEQKGQTAETSWCNKEQPLSFDNRHLALSQSSKRIFEAINVWHDLQHAITPIKKLHVSEQGRFAQATMRAEAIGLDALGYVIIAKALGQTLWQHLKQQDNVSVMTPASIASFEQRNTSIKLQIHTQAGIKEYTTRLLVFADGTESEGRLQLGLDVCEKDYGQTAMVANIKTEHAHQHTAYERFTKQGPFALLPNGPEHMAMIFCLPSTEAKQVVQWDDMDFLQAAHDRFGRRLGRFISSGIRVSYPLKLIQIKQHFIGRALVLGNAAHTIHPNGAQGFNLALRDVAGLRDAIVATLQQKGDIGCEAMLNHYQHNRSQDQERVIRFSDGLCHWFYNNDPVKKCIRSLGIAGIELLNPVKNHFMLQASGLQGQQPEWVRHGV